MLTILWLLVPALAGPQAPAQTPAPTGPPPVYTVQANVVNQYRIAKRLLLRAADVMPGADYTYRPTPEMRTFAGAVAHAAANNYRMCGTLSGAAPPVDPHQVDGLAGRDEVLQALTESFAFCDAYVDAVTDENFSAVYTAQVRRPDGTSAPLPVERGGLLANLVSHNNEMYGYLAVYLRMKGLVPPSSQPRRPAGR